MSAKSIPRSCPYFNRALDYLSEEPHRFASQIESLIEQAREVNDELRTTLHETEKEKTQLEDELDSVRSLLAFTKKRLEQLEELVTSLKEAL